MEKKRKSIQSGSVACIAGPLIENTNETSDAFRLFTVGQLAVKNSGPMDFSWLTVPCHRCGKECPLEDVRLLPGRNLCFFHLMVEKVEYLFGAVK